MNEISDTVLVDTERAVASPFAPDENEREAWRRALADGSLPQIAFSGLCTVVMPCLLMGRVQNFDAFRAVIPYVPIAETLLGDLGEGGILQVPLYVPADDCQPVENEDE
jgi:hypothetical protein